MVTLSGTTKHVRPVPPGWAITNNPRPLWYHRAATREQTSSFGGGEGGRLELGGRRGRRGATTTLLLGPFLGHTLFMEHGPCTRLGHPSPNRFHPILSCVQASWLPWAWKRGLAHGRGAVWERLRFSAALLPLLFRALLALFLGLCWVQCCCSAWGLSCSAFFFLLLCLSACPPVCLPVRASICPTFLCPGEGIRGCACDRHRQLNREKEGGKRNILGTTGCLMAAVEDR